MTQKNRTHIFLTEIHEFNSSHLFFSGYEVDSVYNSIHQYVQKFECTKLELFCFIFVEITKKFMGCVFWVTLYDEKYGKEMRSKFCLGHYFSIRFFINLLNVTFFGKNPLKVKLNCSNLIWHLNCILMLNWNSINRTILDVATALRPNWIVWKRTVLTFNCV